MYGEVNYNTPWRKTRTVLQVVLTAMLVLGLISAGATSAVATPDCDEGDEEYTSAPTPTENCDEQDNDDEGDREHASAPTPPEDSYSNDGVDVIPDINIDGVSKSESDGISHPTARVGAYGGGSIEGITTEQNERIRG